MFVVPFSGSDPSSMDNGGHVNIRKIATMLVVLEAWEI